MRKGMFGKLAVQNIRNNRSTYVPYMLTCIFCIAMMYMMEFLRDCPTLEKAVPQAAEVRMIVGTGEVVVGIFCVIFLSSPCFCFSVFFMFRQCWDFMFPLQESCFASQDLEGFFLLFWH